MGELSTRSVKLLGVRNVFYGDVHSPSKLTHFVSVFFIACSCSVLRTRIFMTCSGPPGGSRVAYLRLIVRFLRNSDLGT